MPKLELVIRGPKGDVVPSATVSVFDADTATLVNLFSDFGLSVPTENPGIADSEGRFKAYAAQGRYDVRIARSGILTLDLEDVELVSAP